MVELRGGGRRYLPRNDGCSLLLDAEVVSALRQMPERARFTKGLYAWAGFQSIGIPYDRPNRKKGQTKWNYWRLWNLALDGILSFSQRPLRLFTYSGIIISVASLFYAANTVIKAIFLGIDTKGYASLMTAVTFLGGLQLLFFGVPNHCFWAVVGFRFLFLWFRTTCFFWFRTSCLCSFRFS